MGTIHDDWSPFAMASNNISLNVGAFSSALAVALQQAVGEGPNQQSQSPTPAKQLTLALVTATPARAAVAALQVVIPHWKIFLVVWQKFYLVNIAVLMCKNVQEKLNQ